MPTENVIKNIVKSGTTYEIHDDRLDNFTSTYVLTYNDPVHSFADAYAAYQAGKILVCVNEGMQYQLSSISTEYMQFSNASVSGNELNGVSYTFYPNGRWYTFNSLGLVHVEASTEAVQGADTLKSIQVGTVPYNIPEGGSSVEIDNLTIVESDDGKLMTAIGGYIEQTDGAMINRNGDAGTDMDGYITHAEMEEFFSTIQPDTDYAVTVTAVSVDPSFEVPEFSDAYFRCSASDGSYDPSYPRIGANADCLHFTVTDAIGEHTDVAAELYFDINEDRVHCYFGNTGLYSLGGIKALLVSFEDVAMHSEVAHKIDERVYTRTKLVTGGNGLNVTEPDENGQQHVDLFLDYATVKTDQYGNLCTAVGGHVTQEEQPTGTIVIPDCPAWNESAPIDRDDTNEFLFSEELTFTKCNFAIYRTDVEPRVQVVHGNGYLQTSPSTDQTQSQFSEWTYETADNYSLSTIVLCGYWHTAAEHADKLTTAIGIDPLDAPADDAVYELEIEPLELVDVYHPIDNRFIQLPQLPAAPSVDGEYNLHCSVVNGEATYSWVSGGGDELPDAEGGSF